MGWMCPFLLQWWQVAVFTHVTKGSTFFSSIDDVGTVFITFESIVLGVLGGGLMLDVANNSFPLLGAKKF
jgi:hypothetical protein